jgi:hypothetical protein
MKRVSAVFAMILLAAVLAACSRADSSEAKIEVIKSYIAATNDQNWDEAAKYLAEDILFETPTGSCQGLETCLGDQKGPDRPDREEASNFSVDGNTVRWEMIAVFPDFQAPALGEAVVQDGKILRYTVTAQ